MPNAKVDLSDAKALIDDANKIIDSVDGLKFDIAWGQRQHGSEIAEVCRQLLIITQRLRHAAAETEMQYYRMKGTPDPRFEEAS